MRGQRGPSLRHRPNQPARIFEPFYTMTEIGKGTGHGLSQVFGFAKRSGGDVDVARVLGRGTIFTLCLPETEARPREEPASNCAREDFHTSAGQCVLVLEANVEVGRFATQILEDLGCEPNT